MLALGIDPGTAICGYGLVRLERQNCIKDNIQKKSSQSYC